MSSFPPYNPDQGDRAVWVHPALGASDLPSELVPGGSSTGAAMAASGALAEGLRARLPGVDVTLVEDPAQVALPERGYLVAAGPPSWAEALVRRLMGMPDGSASIVLLTGAATVIHVTADRCVLARLNDGRSLD